MDKNKSKIHNPHDALLRRNFQNMAIARDVLSKGVSECVRDQICWESLQLEHTTYVHEELQVRESDLVFSATLHDGRASQVLVFLEIESTAKADFAIRFNRYLALAIEKCYHRYHKKGQKLPLIVPVGLYVGKSPFPYSLDLLEYFEDPKLEKQLLYAPLTLIDVPILTQEQLATFGAAKLILELPVRIRSPEAMSYLERCLQSGELDFFAQSYGEKDLRSAIIYILSLTDSTNRQRVLNMLRKELPHYTQEVRSIADAIRKEGWDEAWVKALAKGLQEGREEGLQQGQQEGEKQRSIEIARSLLKKKIFNRETISEMVKLPIEVIRQLEEEV